MTNPTPKRLALMALARKAEEQAEVQPVIKALRAELFDRQLAFWDDKSRNKAALCTRRAGKTSMWARYCTATALQNPRTIIRIWSINRLRCKQLLWEEFKYLVQRHGIGVHFHDTELTMRFDNGAEIRLLGADKDKEAQKKRGDKTILEVVTEAQLFGPFLKTLVEDVIEPCLFDLRGTVCLEGTPGPLCVGYWFDVSGRENVRTLWTSVGSEDRTGAGWSCHRWSVLDNPFLPHAKEELASLKEKKRWTNDNPTYVREWLGKWVADQSALYYDFDEARNTHERPSSELRGDGWQHALGWDIGFHDDMALTIWAWHENDFHLYEAESWKKSGALSEEIINKIKEWEGLGYNFIHRVADTGGGGKLYVEEIRARYEMHFEAAQKTNKYDHVRLLNDDLRTGKVKIRKGSSLALEMAQLPKDPDWDPMEGPPKEDPRYPNHQSDSALYAWRAAYPYLAENKPIVIKRGTPEYFKNEEKEMLERVERPKPDWWDTDAEFDSEYL